MLTPETESGSITTKLSGGFTIKDILKRERSFDELFGDKRKHRRDQEREDEKDALFQSTNDDIPNKPSKAYSKYVLQLQEKIQQRLLRKNNNADNQGSFNFSSHMFYRPDNTYSCVTSILYTIRSFVLVVEKQF